MGIVGNILPILGGFGETFAFLWGNFCPGSRQNKDFLLVYTAMHVTMFSVQCNVNCGEASVTSNR